MTRKPIRAAPWSLRDLKRFDEVFDAYDRALALKPDYPEASWRAAIFSTKCS